MSKICRQTPVALEQSLQDRCKHWSTHKPDIQMPDKLSSSPHLLGVTGYPSQATHSVGQQIQTALHKAMVVYSSNRGGKKPLFRTGTLPQPDYLWLI